MAKEIKTRQQQKHDTETNWSKATNFIPMIGELIIYDRDDNYDYERFKIGDGESNVNDLPFSYYSKADIDSFEFITIEDIDTICGMSLNSVYIGENAPQNDIGVNGDIYIMRSEV